MRFDARNLETAQSRAHCGPHSSSISNSFLLGVGTLGCSALQLVFAGSSLLGLSRGLALTNLLGILLPLFVLFQQI